MFTLGAMIAAGETKPSATFPLSEDYSVSLGMKDVPSWPSFRNKRFALCDSMFFYANTSDDVTVRYNDSGAVVAQISDSMTDIDQVAAPRDGSRMIVATHLPGGGGATSGDTVHFFRDDTSDWTSYTKEQSVIISSPWNTIWDDIVSGVQCNSNCDIVAIAGAMGLKIYNRSETTWSSTDTVDFSAWPDAAPDYSILANNNITDDRIVLAVDTDSDQSFDYIIVMKRNVTVWEHEFTQPIVDIEDGNFSVNDDCTEIVWSDGVDTKSITRSGTTWSVGLSISGGTNTFHVSSISPDGSMMVCNVNDFAQSYSNDGGTWSLVETEAWDTFIPGYVGGKIDIGWSGTSGQLLIVPDGASSPSSMITVLGRSVV